ncbi:5-formyltetrahydrofolate cyclo-ligase [Symbioplanes lichenis]|uniref:5-formyltetrahydrofolate cyclo-ligase n=1 Tax=Symbioplanes lichenis TaxID=1629072 RepID=UPI002739AB2C|nr:5-formyltetrahydrofolate cyclo-ligase [Actinoplanes lichenis]
MPDSAPDAGNFVTKKFALRTQLLAERASKTPGELADAARAVQDTLVTVLTALSPRVVAAYVPLGSEPGGADLADVLLRGVAPELLLLPVLLPDGDLDWARYNGPSSLRPGRLGLREPAGPGLGVFSIAEADIVVVPALAVDRTGLRMGRGGGSYDRALARVTPAARTLALLHDGELLDSVPAEPHDRRVGAVITPGEGLSALPDWTK